jgi:hypothetical protein
MSERKVLNKYYPPDYNPALIPRVKRKSKLSDIRTMAPFNMKCNTCGNYIAGATKFNAKKEVVEGESYHNLKILRFYIKCPRCMAAIVYRTDLGEAGYVMEQGATENYRAVKVSERLAREQAEAEEEEEKIDPMKQLENRTKTSKQQMEASEQIQSLRTIKHKLNSVDLDSLIKSKQQEASRETMLAIGAKEEDDEIKREAKRILMKRKAPDSDSLVAVGSSSSSSVPKTAKISPALAALKKKMNLKNNK